jgi:hypothetical protein
MCLTFLCGSAAAAAPADGEGARATKGGLPEHDACLDVFAIEKKRGGIERGEVGRKGLEMVSFRSCK